LAGVIGSVVGAPGVGTLAQTGVSVLLKALGLKPDAKPEDAMKIITTDPEVQLKLIVAENEFKLKQREQEIEELKTRLSDVQSARSREVEIVKATGKKDLNLYVLSWVIMGGFIGLIGALIFFQFSYGKTLQSDPIITLCLGSFATDAGMVVGYFFGSSKGSHDKDRYIAGRNSG
jgi:hypothetical protein